MSTPLLLEVSGLSKSFGPLKAVNNASFVIRQGQVVGLIGSNGAGKTTLMRMLATLAVVVLGVKLACFSWGATVIPLLFPRLTILAMQILGMYKPPKNKEGGDEPV